MEAPEENLFEELQLSVDLSLVFQLSLNHFNQADVQYQT